MTRRRWALLAASAAALGAGLLLYLVLSGRLAPAHLAVATETPVKRAARGDLRRPPLELPLVRLSRVHVAVAAQARASGVDRGEPWERELPILVVLDTGASLAFGTAELGVALPLRTAPSSRGARSFSGERGSLYPIETGEELTLSVGAAGDPRRVTARVDYLAPATLYGSHVIAPPQALAPIGGATLLDLEHDRLLVCESATECRTGSGWQPLTRRPCPEDPELVGVDVSINGQALPLHLDTGAPTLLFRRYFDAAHLGEATRALEPGSLSGISGAASVAVLATGAYEFQLSAGLGTTLETSMLWVVGQAGEAGPTSCFPAGSIGTDLLKDCQILLDERPGATGAIRCSP